MNQIVKGDIQALPCILRFNMLIKDTSFKSPPCVFLVRVTASF
jgi:hypothetical protein